jgi:DNA-binding transcriptional MerR regulator
VSDDGLLRIGDFARASWLSVKSLRAYHEMGLLVPAVIDPQTGFRCYSVGQLIDAAVIRRLRQMDVPLASIQSVLEARDPAITHKVLAEHAIVLEERLAALQHAVDDLYRAVESPSIHTPVYRRHDEACTTLTVGGTVTEDAFAAFLTDSRTRLVDAAARSGALVAGPFGGCYPPLLDDDEQDVTTFLPVDGAPLVPSELRAAGVSVGELPESDVAVLTHLGSYDTLDDSYMGLGAWVAANAQPRDDLPVRELYLVSDTETDETEDFRTEICWPIHPATGR